LIALQHLAGGLEESDSLIMLTSTWRALFQSRLQLLAEAHDALQHLVGTFFQSRLQLLAEAHE